MHGLLRSVSGSVYGGDRFLGVFIHGWDLAVASGQNSALDPSLVDACHKVIAPQADLLRASGAFGARIKVEMSLIPRPACWPCWGDGHEVAFAQS